MTAPNHFLQTLKTISEQHPENDAFCIDGKTYTYAEFYQKVNAITHELLAEKKQQLKVIVATNNDLETYASIIAIWQTGNIYIPLNISENHNKTTAIINTIKPDILLNSESKKNRSR